MTFFKDLDTIMKQDFGNRGLLKALPDNPIRETLETLSHSKIVRWLHCHPSTHFLYCIHRLHEPLFLYPNR